MHYHHVSEVDLRHRYEGDGVMRTNAEWDIIHEAFSRKHAQQDARGGSSKAKKRLVNHGYKQSGSLF